MPPPLPTGESVPDDGHLPDAAANALGARSFGAYVHVPFCAARCGYCDFNTYTPNELGGTSAESYVTAALGEIALARTVALAAPPLETVFFGGGTPTMLPSSVMARMLHTLRDTFGFQPNAEVTTEANPESVDEASLHELREAGFNRISFGMQSAVPHVLATLDRVHSPGRVIAAVKEARSAGFDDISVDLIYGAPGESIDDWRTSLHHAVSLEPDHLSAYALIVEPGTRMANQVQRGELPPPDEDEQAAKYEMADDLLAHAGFEWYEVSNWSRGANTQSRHNLGYWLGADWWGFGPGAHSHVAGVRWWNVKHPRAYAERLAGGMTPAAGREQLDPATRRLEHVMLGTRLRTGLSASELSPSGRSHGSAMVREGLVDQRGWDRGRVVLTLQGRLLADLVVRRLTDDN